METSLKFPYWLALLLGGAMVASGCEHETPKSVPTPMQMPTKNVLLPKKAIAKPIQVDSLHKDSITKDSNGIQVEQIRKIEFKNLRKTLYLHRRPWIVFLHKNLLGKEKRRKIIINNKQGLA